MNRQALLIPELAPFFPASICDKLSRAGFYDLYELLSHSPSVLAVKLNLSLHQTKTLCEVIKKCCAIPTKTQKVNTTNRISEQKSRAEPHIHTSTVPSVERPQPGGAQDMTISSRLNTHSKSRKKPGHISHPLAVFGAKSIASLLNQRQTSSTRIITFVEKLDRVLRDPGEIQGGLALGSMTEVAGPPGSGKTQLGLSMAVNVQVPGKWGGVNGQAIYVDTDMAVTRERILHIAAAMVRHVRRMASKEKEKEREQPRSPRDDASLQEFDEDFILSNFHLYRVLSYEEFILLPFMIMRHLQRNKNIRLVVIDNIAVHFRHAEQATLQTRLAFTKQLQDLATRYHVAVLLVNQVSTRLQNDIPYLVPALGDKWTSTCSNRIFLSQESITRRRQAMVYKRSGRDVSIVVPFQITVSGVRDVPKENELPLSR